MALIEDESQIELQKAKAEAQAAEDDRDPKKKHGHHHRRHSSAPDTAPTEARPTTALGNFKHFITHGRKRSLIDEDPATANWNLSFFVVSVPFLIMGFPVHLMLGARGHVGDEESTQRVAKITTTTGWIRSIWSPFSIIRVVISVVLAILALVIVVYFFYILGVFFYNLVWLGLINDPVFDSFSQITRILPIAVPVIYFWLYGYSVKHVLDSFNAIFAAFAKAVNSTWKSQSHSPSSRDAGPEPGTKVPQTTFWYKLAKFYSVIVIMHSLELYMDTIITNNFKDATWIVYLGYIFEIMNSLVLPVYCMFCWVLQSELELLIDYLNILVYYQAKPSFTIFNEIKFLYKKIARQIMAVNWIFGIYMSWLIFVIWGFACLKLTHTCVVFFKYLQVTPNGTPLPGFLGGQSFKDAAAALTGLLPTTTIDQLNDEAKILLRQALCLLLIALVQIGLICYTAYQAIEVNRAARSLHVIINDFVTYQMGSDMTPDLYHAFRLLKAFIHSTMERSEDPALLRLSVLNYGPYFGDRLHSYGLHN